MGQFLFGLGRWWRALVALTLSFSVLSVTGFLESQLFYWPIRGEPVTPPGAEDVWFENADGQRLHGWWLPAEGVEDPATAPVIVHTHGNMGHVAFYYLQCAFLQDAGFNVLLFDYRGFGRSEPNDGPTERLDLLEDTRAALAFARTRSNGAPMGVYGLSLGGVIGLAAAAEDHEIAAVGSVSAFASWERIASDRLGFIGRLLIEPGLDAEVSAAALGERPLLIVHGDLDKTVNLGHADTIEEAARAAGVVVRRRTAPGAFHINAVLSDRDSQREVEAFFREHLLDREAADQPGGLDPDARR